MSFRYRSIYKTHPMKTIITFLFLFVSNQLFAQPCVPNTNSLEFDGLSSYISVPSTSALDITDMITIEAWINSSAWGTTSAKNSIVCKHGWTFGEEGYVLRTGGTGELSFNIAGIDQFGVPVSWQEVVSPIASLQLNTWYHVAGTFDGNYLRIYINGNIIDSVSFTGTIALSSDYSLAIGKLADISQPEGRFFSGYMDEVRIWHRVLSEQELSDSMNTHIDPSTAVNLVAYYRFNEGSGVYASDLSPSGATGSLISTTWSTSVPFTTGPPTPLLTWNGTNLLSSASYGNQWFLNGNLIAGAVSQTYVPAVNGIYTVTFTDSSGCSTSSSPYNLTTVNINELFPQELLVQSPVHHNLIISEEGSYILTDIRGRIVLEKFTREAAVIDVSHFENGLYILNREYNHKQSHQKIVIN
jgi:hypothetical protein